MSDSISKWQEMQEEEYINYIFESPDGGKTVTRRPVGGDWTQREVIKVTEPIVSEGHKKQAYQILIDYPKEAIFEAARIAKSS